jgi:hypothetical protein
MISVTVNGNSYSSIAAAWREESPRNLPLITVRVRLKMGWTAKDAFTLPSIEPKKRRLGHE